MKREDKFGRKIFSNAVWEQMLLTGKKLNEFCYVESTNKPNLFYAKREYGMFFADTRGTDIVPIWDDPRPMFYWRFNEDVPRWKARRLIKQELIKLGQSGAKCRLSFYASEDDWLMDTSGTIDEENLIFDWNDGFCKFCGKDFQGEGTYCSKECENKQIEEWKETFAACKEKIDLGKEIVHHVRYSPPKTVLVHSSCHAKIHQTYKYPELKPPDKGNYPKKKKTSKNEPAKAINTEGISADQFCIVCLKVFKNDSQTQVYKGHRIHSKCVPRREIWNPT